MHKIIVLLVLFALLTGCAATETIERLESRAGQGNSQALGQDSQAAPAGFGDLHVSLTVKTRMPNSVLIDTTDYGTNRYQLLVGAGDQFQRVTGDMTMETGGYRTSTDPEAGNGVRYRFAATLRLPVGTHRVTAALPGDGVVLEQLVEIKQGSNRLELKPVYRLKSKHRRIGFPDTRTYYKGVKKITVVE
ncbi:MAG: hypothetical protein KKE83_02585 [Proteobacteria bacterium]|nr:hypothetical protein [Pseudomonadota bacterium]MBU1545879.1 hypothetical protein [Pseudomonadota bacterium]MBU2618552.1 hypothetical protein [Pseudomonadota bacterium]